MIIKNLEYGFKHFQANKQIIYILYYTERQEMHINIQLKIVQD